MATSRYTDWASLATIVITLVLFVAAIWAKGFTHDLLLEAGVFLVSVKLILMSYNNGVAVKDVRDRLERIEAHLK
ncbi:MAG: hypothetical protein JWO87_265 [Phycisphaerales bacterium]|jgi:hypothetical protein|nr:hypothetical protein [Phycisphaerales bacterium]MDB5298602.1 hypothetical protein [Phycisphaerales bacterium]MDB5302488.1 hypothetical protein [Phycisphaerales bacterium]